ncbi:MAG: hypothetical protein GC200_00570 [Tepidisphaera sp.]|nr:hypothetical protein [Tepidisphaera sp.]
MAGRNSTSFGIGATITVLAIGFVGFFIGFAIFFGKYSDSQRTLRQAQTEQAEVIKADERNRDDVRALIEQGKKAGNKSLVGFLLDAQQAMMQRVTGAGKDTPADLADKLKNIPGSDSASLIAIVNADQAKIGSLQQQLGQAEAARASAVEDQKAEVARVNDIQSKHQATIDALNKEIDGLKGEIAGYRKGTDDYKAKVDAQLDGVRQTAAETEKRLKDQLDKLTEAKLIVENQLAVLRGQKNQGIVQAGDEAALVDGEVLGINGTDGQIYISIGKKDNVVLGMTFAVYSSAAAMRPDAQGNTPAPKATLEVVNISESTSACRITSEVRGNPVVKGDVIANAVYDPHKVYRFVIFGNFDANRDGLATPLERNDIRALIEQWGGKVDDELGGDTDFLVLGQRPILPPRPDASAPLEVVQEFIRRQKDLERYDDLYKKARDTSVPILNENRLYTLIGKTPSRVAR